MVFIKRYCPYDEETSMNWFLEIIHEIFKRPAYKTDPMSEQPNPDYIGADWSNPITAHHNVRALCDLEGLTYDQKESLTACVYVESQFHIDAEHKNYIFTAEGEKYLASTDFGICQWNDYWHGKEITPTQALNDPEMAIRLMCTYWKAGRMNQWVSYSSKAYVKYLGKV